MADSFWPYIKFFRPSDIVCKCGCGTNNIAFEVMWLGDRLREKYRDILLKEHDDFAARLLVSSGCRCPKHNFTEKGSSFSYHLTISDRLDGRALDLQPMIVKPYSMEVLAEAATVLNPPGLKIYSTFVHIDFRIGRWRE